eukprot:973458-Prymnesium_polylepis.1
MRSLQRNVAKVCMTEPGRILLTSMASRCCIFVRTSVATAVGRWPRACAPPACAAASATSDAPSETRRPRWAPGPALRIRSVLPHRTPPRALRHRRF